MLRADLNKISRRQEQISEELQDDVRLLRMVPTDSLRNGLSRTVRDTARSAGRQAVLVVEGGETELDRAMLEGLRDPLIHLVLKHLPVILVTSFGSVEEKQRGADVGADAYVVKGEFDQDTLLAAIDQQL